MTAERPIRAPMGMPFCGIWCVLALAGSLLVVTTAPLGAQGTVVIDRSRVCETCSIALRLVTTLRDSPATPFGVNGAAIARDASGRIFVPSRGAPGEVYVFDGDGKFLRTLGRRGDGPGEYRVVNEVRVGARDSLYLFDNANARMTVLATDLTVARTARMPVAVRPTEVVITSDGIIIAADRVSTPDRVGLPLHVVDQSGTLLRSFGSDDTTRYVAMPFAMSRALALDRQGLVWAALRTSYRLVLWDLEGSQRIELSGNASWFRPWATDAPLKPDAPPLPWIQAIQVDHQGHIWVLCRVASEDFARSLVPEDTPRGRFYRIADYARAFDTVIEVIDPTERRLIASARFDAYLTNFVEPGTALGFRESAIGVPALDLWEVRLDTH